jgi:hypothetical protein
MPGDDFTGTISAVSRDPTMCIPAKRDAPYDEMKHRYTVRDAIYGGARWTLEVRQELDGM